MNGFYNSSRQCLSVYEGVLFSLTTKKIHTGFTYLVSCLNQGSGAFECGINVAVVPTRLQIFDILT